MKLNIKFEHWAGLGIFVFAGAGLGKDGLYLLLGYLFGVLLIASALRATMKEGIKSV